MLQAILSAILTALAARLAIYITNRILGEPDEIV